MERPGLDVRGHPLVYALALTEGVVWGIVLALIVRQQADYWTVVGAGLGLLAGPLFARRYVTETQDG